MRLPLFNDSGERVMKERGSTWGRIEDPVSSDHAAEAVLRAIIEHLQLDVIAVVSLNHYGKSETAVVVNSQEGAA